MAKISQAIFVGRGEPQQLLYVLIQDVLFDVSRTYVALQDIARKALEVEASLQEPAALIFEELWKKLVANGISSLGHPQEEH